jgi:N-acetyl-alpha-D-muramate 1-phosphate uridylyltransferase
MASRPTRAMVLAAGLGTRMRPLSDKLPKPLVSFAGKPLLDHVLDRLAEAGITSAVVNVHYMAEQIERHLSARSEPSITLSDEREHLLDTGGGVYNALQMFEGEVFVIHNSDSVWLERGEGNLARMFSAWDETAMDSLLLLAPVAGSLGYDGAGDFDLDRIGRLSRRSGAHAAFAFTGVSIAHPRLFEGAAHGAFSLNKLWDKAIVSGRLFGIALEGTWMHIGTPEALHDAERFLAGERDR